MVSSEQAVTHCFKALADGTRRRILNLLAGRELSVLEIAEEFPMSRPAISKHLRILRDAGLVAERPSGRQRLYALDSGPLAAVEDWLRGFSLALGAGAGRRPPAAAARPRARSRPPAPRAAGHNDWRVW